MPATTVIQSRRDTAANWTSVNPTLANGEYGVETDTNMVKIGNGSTAWNSLPYYLVPLIDEYISLNPLGAHFDGTGFRNYTLNDYATAPNAAPLQITGDITLIAYVKPNAWGASQTLLSRLGSGDISLGAYGFGINSNKTLGFSWSNSSTVLATSSSVGVSFNDGVGAWLAVTLDVNNGSSQNEVKFFTSTDASTTALASITWTQLGTTVTQSGTTSINAGTRALHIGINSNQLNAPLKGYFYRAVVGNGIGVAGVPGGTTVFDANFASVPSNSLSFAESSANAAVVTLATSRYAFGYPGATLFQQSTLAMAANTTTYNMLQIRNKPITLQHIAFETTTAPTSTATVRFAIYKADNNMQPVGAPIYNSGAVTVSTSAAVYRLRTTPTLLTSGYYLLAFNTTVAFTARLYTLSMPNRPVLNSLGANSMIYDLTVSQTLTENFPDTPVPWNTIRAQNSPLNSIVMLGWS